MRGQLLITFFDKDGVGGDYIDIFTNNVIQKRIFKNSNNLYTCPINIGDVVKLEFFDLSPIVVSTITLIRRDYTTDSSLGLNGIVETTILYDEILNTITFTASTINSAYDFEYIVDAGIPAPPCANISTGISQAGSALEFQNDGKMLIGIGQPLSARATYQGTTIGKYFRLNTDFTLDTGFSLNTTNAWTEVEDIKMYPENKIIIAGSATSGNTSNSNGYNIRKLNSDGTEDITFNKNYFFGLIWHTEILSDNGIIAVGQFDNINPTNNTLSGATKYNGYVKLNSNGIIDNTFYSGGTGTGFETPGFINQVYSVAVQSTNKIIFGGNFTQFNGTSCRRLERLNPNGTFDNTFNSGGTGPNGIVFNITVQSDNKILVASSGGSYNGTSVGQFYRLNADGTLDTTWNNGGTGLNGDVLTPGRGEVVIELNGKYLIQAAAPSGTTLSYNGTTVGKGLIRLNSNGTLDTTWNNGGVGLISVSSPSSAAQVGSVKINPNNNLPLAVGWGTSATLGTIRYNGTTVYGVYEFKKDGTLNNC